VQAGRPALHGCGCRRGGALLTVLWLSAALSAIAFSLANNVRGETERASTYVDGLRAYYLATGGLDRALLYVDWGYQLPDGTPRYWVPGIPILRFQFPTGEAEVEIIPEGAKININRAEPEQLYALLLGAGSDPARAREITLGIVDWRGAAPDGPTEFDRFYLSLNPSFRSRHTSFEEIEELLLIKGMTPEIFYGSFARGPEGRLVPRAGLRECVTVYGSGGAVDVNSAEPAVLSAVGLAPDAVAYIVASRQRMPFRSLEQLAPIAGSEAAQRLRIGGGSIFTLRSTAHLHLPDGKLSDSRRSVAAMYKRLPPEAGERYHLLRWYDNVWVQ
jgi:general secretion pathway protein K